MKFTYCVCCTLCRWFAYTFLEYEIVHRERIPETGPLLLAANHTSYFDPPLVGICCRRDAYYLARDTLLKIPLLGPLLPDLNVIPVDRSRGDMKALKAVIRTVREGNATVVFPEGTRSPDGNIQRAKPGLGFLIAKTGAPVVPVRLFGSYDAFPKDAKLPHRRPVRAVIGHPMTFSQERPESRDRYLEMSQQVLDAIAALTPEG